LFLKFFPQLFMNIDEDDEKSGMKKMKKARKNKNNSYLTAKTNGEGN